MKRLEESKIEISAAIKMISNQLGYENVIYGGLSAVCGVIREYERV